MKISSAQSASAGDCRVLLTGSKTAFSKTGLSKAQTDSIRNAVKNEKEHLFFPAAQPLLVVNLKEKKTKNASLEYFRKLGAECTEILNEQKVKSVFLENQSNMDYCTLPFTEGLALSNYQFLRYKSSRDKVNSLDKIRISKSAASSKSVNELEVIVDATNHSRDLVNEPLSFLTAPQFSKEMQKLGKKAGFSVQVFNKKKIQSLGMGGLLAVNLGSVDPPTFTIMEWKPPKARNKKPVILVGKGVVYDTGGLSLKPTKNSMDFMKCDMGGAAAVVGAMYAVAKSKLPLHVIGLIPATDNRPGGNAYVPGDVIKMYSGKTVEVLNTDAEGRMCLADALTWAARYKPELVIDLATLTGAAARAIGIHGLVGMGNAGEKQMKNLQDAGEEVYERVVEFPMWEEYGDEIISDIADIKNVGSTPSAGMITAGKFLEHFTSYPWIHLDIAGPAWLNANAAYRTKNGSGAGTRLLYAFLKNYGK